MACIRCYLCGTEAPESPQATELFDYIHHVGPKRVGLCRECSPKPAPFTCAACGEHRKWVHIGIVTLEGTAQKKVCDKCTGVSTLYAEELYDVPFGQTEIFMGKLEGGALSVAYEFRPPVTFSSSISEV